MPEQQTDKQDKLHFLLDEKGFRLDMPEAGYGEAILHWRNCFEKDRWQALYDLGFQKKPGWLDAAGSFLYRISECFQEILTHQPDLEVSRENTVLEPDEMVISRLMDSVPFTLGSEYVNESWIRNVFERLRLVFAGELASFDGSAALYLAGKSQKLRMPERIFFHLVESGGCRINGCKS